MSTETRAFHPSALRRVLDDRYADVRDEMLGAPIGLAGPEPGAD